MKRLIVRAAAGGIGSAAAMGIVGWSLPVFQMAGPRPGPRIATLMPQIEVTALFLLLLPACVGTVPPSRFDAWRRALAVTARGPRLAIARAATSRLVDLGAVLAGGSLAWLAAMLLTGGPTIAHVVRVRGLLLAFAVFGLGLALATSVLLGGSRAAPVVVAGVALGLALVPLAVSPIVATAGARPALIQAAMLGCPWLAVAGVAGLDLVRAEWLYALSPLGSVDARYPDAPTVIAVYVAAGLGLLAVSVRTLGRARRA